MSCTQHFNHDNRTLKIAWFILGLQNRTGPICGWNIVACSQSSICCWLLMKVVIIIIDCPTTLDIVFVIDLSGSVEDDYNLVIDFTRQTAANLDIDSGSVRPGVVTFAGNVTNVIYLDEFIQRGRNFTDALHFIHDSGRTNTQVGRLIFNSRSCRS